MYSASTVRYLPKACCSPTWNSLRVPGESGVALHAPRVDISALTTGSLHPRLDSTRFSLNGVSMVRAYENRTTEWVALMWYAAPRRGLGGAEKLDIRLNDCIGANRH